LRQATASAIFSVRLLAFLESHRHVEIRLLSPVLWPELFTSRLLRRRLANNSG